ncbi:MAG: zinc ribbon domain-containing protein [Kiritimatiellae bacterium]|nr:zinc ribbon domain-containing protein [Kiritimatiellia bacterium]
MPTYVYEAVEPEKGCAKCRAGFETAQSIHDARLSACPACGARVYRVVQAPGLAHSKTDLHYRAKRAGFHSLKRVSSGEYEKMY